MKDILGILALALIVSACSNDKKTTEVNDNMDTSISSQAADADSIAIKAAADSTPMPADSIK